jgi:signal transduction histidine kinase
VASAAAWCLIVLVLAGVGLSQQYRQSVLMSLDSDLQVVLDTLAGAVAVENDKLVVTDFPSDPRFNQTFSGRYWQVQQVAGPDMTPSPSLFDERLVPSVAQVEAMRVARGATIFLNITNGPRGQPIRLAGQLLRLNDVNAPIVLLAAADTRPALAAATRFNRTLFLALAALGLGLIVAVVLQVRVAMAPLNRVRADIAEVRTGKRAKLHEDYPTEITPLTTELNALLDHNREVVERARTHVGNLAHALKTPISVLLNESRTEKGKLAELVTRQAEMMARNVDHYLQRAHAAARAEAIGARSPVRPVLDDLARTLERLYGARKDIEVNVSGAEQAWFRGERQDLEEMVGNLMDNACKYGEAKVEARLVAASGPGAALVIEVDDDGPGLSPDQQEVALKRGARLDETAPGQGLGLSIVSELARAYGGSLTFSRAELGGLSARLALPSAD